MKNAEWLELNEKEREEFINKAVEARKNRLMSKKNQKLAKIAEEKIRKGHRITVEEFEALTGIMFNHNMTGKLIDILAIGSSMLANKRCQCRRKCPGLVCSECYAQTIQLCRTSLFENSAYNAKILSEKILPDEVIPEIWDDMLRTEPFGDTNNEIHSANYIKFAMFNPELVNTVWTKNPDHYEKAFKLLGITEKPNNINFILSSKQFNVVDEIPENCKWFIKKTFTVYTLDWLLEHGYDYSFINCGGRFCRGCQNCYKNFNDSPIEIRELLKSDVPRAKKLGWLIED